MLKHLEIYPSKLSGRIRIPPSKSQTLRAILLASMARGESCISGILLSPDAGAMITACRTLGAKISLEGDVAHVLGTAGKLFSPSSPIDAGNSGLVLRFIAAISALLPKPVTITGDESLRRRPMADLLLGLGQLGVRTEAFGKHDCAPVCVHGPLHPGHARVVGRDSQPVSALLFAAALSEGEFLIEVDDPGEKPWVDLTLEWLERLGVDYRRQGYQLYSVSSSGFDAFNYHVPGDLSSCAFPVAAALVTKSELLLEGVDLRDAQGDKKLFSILEGMGADIEVIPERREVLVRPGPLNGIAVDMNDCIDAVVILAVIACYASGETTIYNAAVAREKECDRLAVLCTELSKMGACVEERPDGLRIRGASLSGSELSSHGDHRMAMALAVAAMAASGPSTIRNTACIAKTYPTFVDEFVGLGAGMKASEGEACSV